MSEPVDFDISQLGMLRLLDSGGQGKVYSLPEFAEPDVLYKEYSPRFVDDVDVEVLRRLVAFPGGLSDRERSELLAFTAWPQAVVRRSGVVRGFLMKRAPAHYSAELRFGGETDTVLTSAEYLLNPPGYLSSRGLDVDDAFRLRFLRDTAEGLSVLHALDISVGDLSPKNLLFSRTERPHGFFIDCDAMRLAGESVLPQVETPDWRVEGEEQATPASDLYKFALLVVRVFAADQQATDPDVVPARLRRMVETTLADNPARRVRASVWVHRIETTKGKTVRAAAPETAEMAAPDPVEMRLIASTTRVRPVGKAARVRPVATPAPVFASAGTRAAGTIFAMFGGMVIFFIVLEGPGDVDTATDRPGTTYGAPYPWSGSIFPPDYDSAYPGSTYSPTRPIYPNPLPTPGNFDLCKLVPGYISPEVRGGEGLTMANDEINSLACDATSNPTSVPAVALPLTTKAPYEWASPATIVGFWGEGTATPRATARLTAEDGTCWQTRFHFDKDYNVTSVGPLSACG